MKSHVIKFDTNRIESNITQIRSNRTLIGDNSIRTNRTPPRFDSIRFDRSPKLYRQLPASTSHSETCLHCLHQSLGLALPTQHQILLRNLLVLNKSIQIDNSSPVLNRLTKTSS